MVRYYVTEFRSRAGPAAPHRCRVRSPEGRYEPGLLVSSRHPCVGRALAGSLFGHALLLGGLTLLVTTRVMPVVPEQQTVALVFQTAAVPAASPQLPEPPQPEPAPKPAAVPAPQQPPSPLQPQATPEPPPPPRLPVSEAPPPPPPPEPQALPDPIALPPPPVEAPLPARRASPPHAHARAAPPAPVRTVPVEPAPAEAAPVPDAAPAAPIAPAAVAPGWQTALAAWLEAHKTYPEAARRRGDQGRAIVRFTVERSGQVLDVRIVSGTGSAILDEAVQRMLHDAHLPAFPPGMDQAQATVTAQIHYRLE